MTSYARSGGDALVQRGFSVSTRGALPLVGGRSVFASVHAASETTLGRAIHRSGRGLHTGRIGSVTILPAPPGQGIVFRRKLRHGEVVIPAIWTRRVRQPLCTTLESSCGAMVRTVEHLLATLAAFEIDNATIEIRGEELPIFDGSATPWCVALAEAGRREMDVPRKALQILRPVEFQGVDRMIRVEPSPALSLDVRIQLQHFGALRWDGAITTEIFRREIAPARSFGRLKWALPMKLRALIGGRPVLRGATFKTTAALVGGRIVGGSRLPEEPVRHRVLDLLGDLALAGLPIRGHVTAVNPSHDANFEFLDRLMADRDAWRIVEV